MSFTKERSRSMKTYGKIDLEARLAYCAARDDGFIDWEEAKRIAEECSEAGAQAVIDEFKRRHEIVIVSEED